MSFTITNNSANAVISAIDTQSSTYGSFTVTSGSFPIAYGESVSGTNTDINDLKGSPEGTILLFLLKGNAQIDYTLNGNLISGFDYSSGWCQISSPIISSGDTISLTIVDATNPYPSPTPTPSTTAAVTPTPTGTPAVTPSPTPSSSPAAGFPVKQIYTYPADGSSNITGCTGNIYLNGNLITLSEAQAGSPPSRSFTGFTTTTSAETPSFVLTMTPQAGYVIADDGTAGAYDRQTLTGFTYSSTGGGFLNYTGTTKFWSGDTQLPYTENGGISYSIAGGFYNITSAFDTGYFNINPAP